MHRERRTKIVATLGPASNTPERIAALFTAGADVFRINMSHTSPEGLKALVAAVRALEEPVGRPIGILVDLQGPKLRLGEVPETALETGAKIELLCSARGLNGKLPVPHPEIFAALQTGSDILIDDGKVALRVESVSGETITAVVSRGGTVKSNKGINLPDTVLDIPALTKKDRADLDRALELDVDWIALSFVQRAEDVAELRKLVAGRAGVLAKIEKPAALSCLDDIMAHADAVMVARGDLGVELPLPEVPGRQKQITRAARKFGKPVVVATQMLESMIMAATPTRAEVSDVATAVFESADAVMLSAETAAGAYSVEAVTMMDRIARAVESDPFYQSIVESQRLPPEDTVPDAILAAVHDVTRTVHAAAIVCWTKSGSTGIRAARERPDAPILALTPFRAIARRLTLVWGLHCIETEDVQRLEHVASRAVRIAYEQEFAKIGDRIVVTAGLPLGTPGATNMLRVAFVTRKDLENG